MSFKKVRSMKKIFLSVLAVFAISFLGVWQSALAIEINEAELAQMRIVSPDLTVDKLNIDEWTSFMHAIQGHEVQVVRDLLKKGASLNLLPDCVKYEYANAFEYLCDLGIGFGSGEHKAWTLRICLVKPYLPTP